MLGKILFYNENKGFGKIVDDKDEKYFFYKNRVKNKPLQINKGDEVRFEYFNTQKGLNAKNIRFISTITSLIDGEMDERTNKICRNQNSLIVLTAEVLKKDMFETTAEYEVRINKTTGMIGKVILKKYDANLKLFKATLAIYDDLVNNFIDFTFLDKVKTTFKMNSNDAKNLYQTSKEVQLFAQLQYKEYTAVGIESLYLVWDEEKYPIYLDLHFIKNHTLIRSNSKNIVFDVQRKLMWQDDDAASSNLKNWHDAFIYAKNLRLGGYSDWRLPTIEELKSTVDLNHKENRNSAFKNGILDDYWSGSLVMSDAKNAWFVGFGNRVVSWGNHSRPNLVRCVRDYKNFDL